MSDQKEKENPETSTSLVAVVRTTVPQLSDYHDYRDYLRRDFLCSCGYCTIAESEGMGVRFTIDHYIPQWLDPTLSVEYSNLIYACDICNILKGDLFPPEEAQANGMRYFRPDKDVFDEHFELDVEASGPVLRGTSPVGEWSVEYLDLNRQGLKRLRKIRFDLAECQAFVAHGVLQLKGFHIDRIDPRIKAKAATAIKQGLSMIEAYAEKIDDLLIGYAASPLLDVDPEGHERSMNRRSNLKKIKPLYAGDWRSPNRKRKKGSSGS